MRALLGRRVLPLLEAIWTRVDFLTPEVAYLDVVTLLPRILAGKGLPEEKMAHLLRLLLAKLPLLVTPVPQEAYSTFETEARRRLLGRDPTDWPFVALALRLGCPIWTEDTDFFGSGVATWTSDRVEIYLGSDYWES